ncbi:hypothetical protein EIP91_002201 [Steccherinum ochraceum]|uniref:DUF6535 domain-containing protein n=1 Tax=Steccherinum ochraceum TaxID=92696 RepID=A0A4R0RPS4_9APHY|nr:hypothetical protein EIP91_002201 [Steccherinum ochraceum]
MLSFVLLYPQPSTSPSFKASMKRVSMPVPRPISVEDETNEGPETIIVESPSPPSTTSFQSQSPAAHSIEQRFLDYAILQASASRRRSPQRSSPRPQSPQPIVYDEPEEQEDLISDPSERHSLEVSIYERPPSALSRNETSDRILSDVDLVESPDYLRSGRPRTPRSTSPTRMVRPARQDSRYSSPTRHPSPASSRSYRHRRREQDPQDVARPVQALRPRRQAQVVGTPLASDEKLYPSQDAYFPLPPLARRSHARLHKPDQDEYFRPPSRPISPVTADRNSKYFPPRRTTLSRRPSAETRLESQRDATEGDLRADARISPAALDATVAWSTCDKKLKHHDYNMVKAWKEDIDTLLVLAGLISAVLTAFIIESYKLLQPDPEDTTNLLLQQLIAQSAGNFTAPTRIQFVRSSFAVRLNTFWFSSLVFSLSSASLGILVKQWLQSFISSAASSPRESARVRQFRYQGLVRWRIPEVIALLPILVQFALGFFFVGLLDLLWTLDNVVAGIVSVIVATSLLFVVVTTFTPSFSQSCPHKSPQSLAVFRVTQWMFRVIERFTLRHTNMLHNTDTPTMYVDPAMFAPNRRRIRANFLDHVLSRHPHTWREREKILMREKYSHLDYQVLVSADATLMDDEFLEEVIRVCLRDTDSSSAVDCLVDILTNRAHATVAGEPHWKPFKFAEPGVCTLINLVLDILPRLESAKVDRVEAVLRLLQKLCHVFPFEGEQGRDHDDAAALAVYQHIILTLSPYLHHTTPQIQLQAFAIMDTSIPRMRLPVAPSAVMHIARFIQTARESGDKQIYYSACRLAADVFNASDIPDEKQLKIVIDVLKDMLTTLEAELTELQGQTGHEYHTPMPSLLLALCDSMEDPERGLVIRPELIATLRTLLHGAHFAHNEVGLEAQRIRDYASDVAREQLRRLLRPSKRPGVLPVLELGEIGLRLPSEPGLEPHEPPMKE